MTGEVTFPVVTDLSRGTLIATSSTVVAVFEDICAFVIAVGLSAVLVPIAIVPDPISARLTHERTDLTSFVTVGENRVSSGPQAVILGVRFTITVVVFPVAYFACTELT